MSRKWGGRGDDDGDDDGQHCASGYSSAQQPSEGPMNKYWFVSSEVAHGNKAPEGRSGQNAPIRLVLSRGYSPSVQR